MSAVIEKLGLYDCYNFIEINNFEEINKFIQSDHTKNPFESPIANFKNNELDRNELKKLAISIIQKNPLHNPFPLNFNQNADTAYFKTIEWVKNFELIPDGELFQEFLTAKYINLTSAAYPESNLENLIPISDWIIFLYLNDDDVEKKDSESLRALNERNMKILKNESELTEKDIPLTHALYDLMKRIRKIANESWINRFLKSVDEHFKSTVWEAENRETGITIPDYDIYLKKRLHTGAVYTVLLLIELAAQINIPETIYEEYLQELSTTCNNIIVWSNDIRSSPKEFEKKFVNNLVFVIQKKFDLSLEESINRAVDLHNSEVNRFEELKEKLYNKLTAKDSNPALEQYGNDICKYVEGMRHWMSSHYDFSLKSARYK